jgi:hypothetical protein
MLEIFIGLILVLFSLRALLKRKPRYHYTPPEIPKPRTTYKQSGDRVIITKEVEVEDVDYT